MMIGGVKPFYEPYFAIAGEPVLQGWAMSSALVGCLLGAMVSGVLSERCVLAGNFPPAADTRST